MTDKPVTAVSKGHIVCWHKHIRQLINNGQDWVCNDCHVNVTPIVDGLTDSIRMRPVIDITASKDGGAQ